MGKNKLKQKKKAFNITGVKKTKPKSKAKPVKTQLKQISVQNKKKVAEMDKQLVELQDKVRQGPASKKDGKSSTNGRAASKKTKSEKDYLQLQQKSQETISELNQMQLS